MLTKAQAMALRHGAELHYCGDALCRRDVGPRGGVTTHTVRVRTSGACKTWVTRPAEFRLPVKHGLYVNASVTEGNAGAFHAEADCPLHAWPTTFAFVDAVNDAFDDTPHVVVREARARDELGAWGVVLDGTHAAHARLATLAFVDVVRVLPARGDDDVTRLLVNPRAGAARPVAEVAR